jgi:hypothetical protein
MNKGTLRRIIHYAVERARRQGTGAPFPPCSRCGTPARLRIPIADNKEAMIKERICVDCAKKQLEV